MFISSSVFVRSLQVTLLILKVCMAVFFHENWRKYKYKIMPSNPICPPVASADMIRVQRMFENRERMHKAILRLQPRETFLVRKSQMESWQVLCLCQGLRLANSRWQVVFPLCRKVAKERPVCCRFEAKDSCHSCDMLQAVCISFCSLYLQSDLSTTLRAAP